MLDRFPVRRGRDDDAGVSARETRELWNMPAFFLLILLLRSAEWLVRRTWGMV